MEHNFFNLIKDEVSDKFYKVVISSPFQKSADIKKIHIEKRAGRYHTTFLHEKKATHENYGDYKELFPLIERLIDIGYKQWEIFKDGENITILTNKKGTITRKVNESDMKPKEFSSHDNQKNYIIPEGVPVDWLIKLSVMNDEGFVKKEYKKKFRQINKFLEIIRDISSYLPQNAKIIDFGCGKSYLTFAMYHYLNEILKKNVTIIGLDIKEDVINNCNKLALDFGFKGLKFLNSKIEDYQCSDGSIDMVVTLHACDTATDYAIKNAVLWGSKVILTVPCCQHELFSQIHNEALNMILKHGILRERFSSIATDALRAGILKDMGYSTSVMEFIETEHTPKNLMIKAVKMGNPLNEPSSEVLEFINLLNVSPCLFNILYR